MTRRTLAARRAGFTLVELLVVIAIIAIIASLTAGVAQRAYIVGRRTQIVADINQLSLACTAFKNDFGFYPPTLQGGFNVPTLSYAMANPSDPSVVVLKQMFRRWDPTSATAATPTPFALNSIPIVPISPATALNNNQALVYFLGGPNGNGWSVATPTAPAGNSKKGPYFDFSPAKLAPQSGGLIDGQYRDLYGMPYAYFASGGNGYPAATFGGTNLDNTTMFTINPFTLAGAGRFVNADSVQIVSAGNDTFFGPGGAWAPGGPGYTPGDHGGDDLANFNQGAQLSASP